MLKIELDMEMPENCMECRFHQVEGLFDSCVITDCLFRDDEDKQRNKNCPLEEVVRKECNNCAYYDNGANDEACNGCFEDEEHLNFKPKAQYYDNEDNVSKSIATAFQFGTAMGFAEKYDEMDRVIKAVTPKEKTGKWIKYSTPICGDQHYQCTNCKWYINFGQWGDVYTKQFKYCPNCGARMVSE